MTRRHQSTRCGFTRARNIQRGKRLCARCRYEWHPGLPLRLTRHQWQTLLRWYVRGLSAAAIGEGTGLHRLRVLRASTAVHEAMQHDMRAVFHGTIEIDETYWASMEDEDSH